MNTLGLADTKKKELLIQILAGNGSMDVPLILLYSILLNQTKKTKKTKTAWEYVSQCSSFGMINIARLKILSCANRENLREVEYFFFFC